MYKIALYRCHGLSLNGSTMHAMTSLLANQLESDRARDQCQSAAVTPAVNLSFSFLSHVSTHIIDFIAMDSQHSVDPIVVSAI